MKRVLLRVDIPWDKMSALILGVLQPLKTPEGQMRVMVEVDATSRDGFTRTTLDTTVRETLQQIGAKVEMWEEEPRV